MRSGKKIISLLLTFVLLFCFCGCQEVVHNGENKEWAPGYLEGDTYVNEFAGIQFVKRNGWFFEDTEFGADSKGPVYDNGCL